MKVTVKRGGGPGWFLGIVLTRREALTADSANLVWEYKARFSAVFFWVDVRWSSSMSARHQSKLITESQQAAAFLRHVAVGEKRPEFKQ